MPPLDKPLSHADASALLKIIQPRSELIAIGPLPGSYSNHTHLIEARTPQGSTVRLVVHRYAEFGAYDRGQKARREFDIFKLLQRHHIPGPEPVYLDETGEFLGSPGIVTRYVSGEQIMAPANLDSWAHSLATVLSTIHAVPCPAESITYLLDANNEASWFLHQGKIPGFMKVDPRGPEVWDATNRLWPKLAQAPSTLIHLDYWPGNLLWRDGRIVAVLDWEEAACGDPAVDVAYFRMNMLLDALDPAADVFLQAYEAETGQRVANLGFWELCAAARPMFAPDVYELEDSAKRQRFDAFIEKALQRAELN